MRKGVRILNVGAVPSQTSKKTKTPFQSEPESLGYTLAGDLFGESQAGGNAEIKPKLIQIPAGRGVL